ncbi:MAG TPA: glycosyltransferase family 2 protein, partial [Candidatus Diapherotrites archaeon]|nr:glycosyltransferase family 2 protein [Candidatus Diapherotrites archaeon]
MGLQASVIIPVYNGAETIAACIDSALKQDFKSRYEVIVVDDGSTDQTGEIVEGFGRKVKLISQKNRGPAAARNAGARAAKGEFIVFMDDDCQADKNWLAEMLWPFESPEVVGVQGRYKNRQREIVAR